MKKICLLLAVCLMLSCFAGCSTETEESTPTPTTEPTETTFAVAQPVPTDEAPTEPVVTEPPVPQVIGYEIDIPERFVASVSEDERMVYISPNAPEDTSAIVVQIQPRDESILMLDANAYMERYTLDGDRQYNTIDAQLTQLDGIDALFVDYVTREAGVYTHYYEYHVVGDRNYMFQFSDSTDNNEWLDLYNKSIESIDMLTQNEGLVLDYSALEKYTLDCGISLYAAPGMKEQDAPGFTDCIGSFEAIILVMKDNKQEHDLVGLSLQDYADLVSQANGLDQFTEDNYGNLHTSFESSDDDGVIYFNNLTVHETQDSFWVLQMTCTANNQPAYNREFALWASSVRAN